MEKMVTKLPMCCTVLTALGQQGMTERTPRPQKLLARHSSNLKLSSEMASGMHEETKQQLFFPKIIC